MQIPYNISLCEMKMTFYIKDIIHIFLYLGITMCYELVWGEICLCLLFTSYLASSYKTLSTCLMSTLQLLASEVNRMRRIRMRLLYCRAAIDYFKFW